MATVETSVRDGVAHLVLNRASALNALDTDTVLAMRAALDQWRDDPGVRAVVVRSGTPRAFCAGGDIRAIREAALRGDSAATTRFFREEYALNQEIAEYPKPYLALIDGVAMGGGLGISVHGAVRVATERSVFAMPETLIGFYPDIGASFFLPRLGGALGRYLGLTGARLSGADAVTAGLATQLRVLRRSARVHRRPGHGRTRRRARQIRPYRATVRPGRHRRPHRRRVRARHPVRGARPPPGGRFGMGGDDARLPRGRVTAEPPADRRAAAPGRARHPRRMPPAGSGGGVPAGP
ncbi:enoyl-CoA hydratase/isomerase [Streptomyces himastatinicus ATCC 53653]|uniref:3-hydroxyisobutyryl-CoA hydrolase n=1 Tax=Streptomyces himastatinicus ATCC 53653 TaxID=457427 RepID=D9W850_9ACTN|nr:enoyl-CoA hydratase/isomerase [Streptomyces himastatinicus ATCC 53653]